MLHPLASFSVSTSTTNTTTARIHVLRGSVVDFQHPNGAIVNAANEGCLGGGGVDGAISVAGGWNLQRDRHALPLQLDSNVRCRTGAAVVTGPGQYGTLGVPYVVHAVGPNYHVEDDIRQAHGLLMRAYQDALRQAVATNNIQHVAFALLSAGIFRGPLELEEVLWLGVVALQRFLRKMDDNEMDVYLCGYTEEECQALEWACGRELGDAIEYDLGFLNAADKKDKESIVEGDQIQEEILEVEKVVVDEAAQQDKPTMNETKPDTKSDDADASKKEAQTDTEAATDMDESQVDDPMLESQVNNDDDIMLESQEDPL